MAFSLRPGTVREGQGKLIKENIALLYYRSGEYAIFHHHQSV